MPAQDNTEKTSSQLNKFKWMVEISNEKSNKKVSPHFTQPHERREEKKKKKRKMGSLIRMIITLLIGVLGFNTMVVNGAPNTNVTSVLCNSGVYTASDPFATSLAYVIAELETITPSRMGRDYYNISPFPNAFAYGHAACGATLTVADCDTCLAAARKIMADTCVSRIGARAVLYDCTIRYEQYPFSD
ncbi:Gnk2 domain-containing protein [Cinnamomum micranthum f. kanehirae]|uniref:Gnk2 domain-containing protein n=1 Tax=Cinnamomum micranthum f. kanehirae TaxID=337451 RepID=A0A443NDR4_9MAGN|nr:Gnk2 domain-containing protein [Cinnamomum micranthum f. kanehirae]